jgi:hypothetical protein
MGRQLAIELDEQQESDFLAFLKTTGDVQVLRTFARTERDLFADHFGPREDGNWSFLIWNRSFEWQPTFARTREDLPEVGRRGLFYVANTSVGPVIEYSRRSNHPGSMPGRIYWGKAFSAPEGIAYDVAAFEKWYERVARWLRGQKR